MSQRETILKVATRLFADKGFERTSVRRIAEKARLSVPGMFHYFPSKEEILNEIMMGFIDEAYARLMDIYTSDVDPVEKLDAVCKFYAEHYAGHKDQLTILIAEGKSLSREHQQAFINKKRVYVEALKRLFNDLAAAGLLKPLDPSVLAFIFFGMVHWTYSWYNPRGEMGPEALGRIFSEVFLRGVLKDQEENQPA
jgi:AcrR family transcriptional regulator